MEKNKLERNIIIYYMFQLLREPLFWGPILITYIQRTSHIGLPGIFFMESVAMVSIFLLEIPMGAVADLLGRRRAIFIGTCFLVVEEILFATSYNPPMAWLANNVMWVIGYSLISGADSSMLYDTLLALGRESEFKRIQGRSAGYRLALIAVCSIFTGYMAEHYLRLPAILGVATILVSCVTTFLFIDPPVLIRHAFSWKNHLGLMKISILFVANHKRIKWIIGFMAFIGVVSKLWFFTYNPYFELVGLPLRDFGWIFFALGVVAAVSSYSADWLAKKWGDVGSIVTMMLLIAVPILVMGIYPCQGMALLVIIQNVVRGYMGPFMDHFLHEHLDSSNRATAMSVKSAVVSLAGFVGLGIFGGMLKMYTLPTCLIILGVFSFICGLFILMKYFQVFRPHG